MIAKPEASVLYRTFVEADRLRVQALADGASRDVANALVADALRVAWPKSREEPWHYLCEDCVDSGYRVLTCPAMPCQRRQAHPPHPYVQPCWCAKGRARQEKPAPTVEDALAAAAKVKKPSRFGR